MPRAKGARKAMTSEHKAALAKGREEGLAVRRYLVALEGSKPKRGRKRTPASIDKKITQLETQLVTAEPLTRLHMLQEIKDLKDEQARTDNVEDLGALEKQFVKVAKAYGSRKKISYGTWRKAGVSAAVLQKAGIARTRG